MTDVCVQESVAVSEDRPAKVSLPDRPRRLLVADDEHLVAAGMMNNLEHLGFEIIGPAADGDQAIELARQNYPDMALLDIRMPRCDGLAAAQVIYHELGIPVIIFSGYSDEEYAQSGARIGIFGYLLKPVTQDQLRVGIEVAWRRFREIAESAAEIHNLKLRLEQRKVIEQAKWMLVKHKGITEPEAMRLLQRQARNNRKQLIDVAQSLIDNEKLLDDM